MGSQGVKDILKFLVQGDQMIKYSSSGETILVLGDTGAGKTTLTHFIALNNDNMRSVAKGAGDYIIEDNTKQICDSTIDSCTVIPELIIDQNANSTAYYDCPGFSDTRSVSHDIGVTYFIQKVIRRIDSVKVVFTISYDSVRQGGDRHAFMNLAQNIHSMFTNIAKFRKSVGLVVTKVDNIMEDMGDGTYKLVADDVMIQNIVVFLKEAKEDLQARMKTQLSPADEQFYANTVTLIDIFINDNEQNKPKIGIFRRPNKAGPLSKLKVLQQGKIFLQKMIYQQLGYTLCDQHDFGYTISDNSKLYLNDLRDGINNNIQQSLSKIGQQLMKEYINQETSSDSIDDLVVKISKAHKEFQNLKSINVVPARDFIKKMIASINELEILISESEVKQINNFCGYLEFIESLMSQKAGQPINWGHSLKDVVSYLRESEEWYRLLIDLRTTLSEYIVQQGAERYDTIKKELLSEIALGDNTGALNSLNKFLKLVNHETKTNYELTTTKLDRIKLRYLDQLLQVMFASNKYELNGNKLLVKGSIIKMGDIVKFSNYTQVQSVEIFGVSKVFFDVNVEKRQGQVIIHSPELEVVNQPSLVLDGLPGLDPPKADSASPNPGQSGTNGHPGNPGGSAGGFWGFGQLCTNCNELTITAVGGKGGKGQNGGDGSDGGEGETPPHDESRCNRNDWEKKWNEEGFTFHFTSKPDAYGCSYMIRFSTCEYTTLYTYTVQGKPGGQGGNGGDGGKGGKGGNPGQVHIVFKGTRGGTKGPNKIILKGQTGEGGLGGVGGHGGKHGKNISQSQERRTKTWTMSEYDACLDMSTTDVDIWASAGNNGTADNNSSGLVPPNQIIINPSFSLNLYKNFLRQNMKNAINNFGLRNFLDYIETDETVNSYYNTKAFVDDLIVMESQVYGHYMSLVNKRTYKNFLERISKYVQSLKEKGMSDDNKLVLGYLYTSILSKLSRDRESLSIELVIDIKGYLTLVTEDIKQLESFKNTVERNKSKDKYQGSLMGKINEANILISREISPEINDNIKQLEHDLQSLLGETIALEEEAEDNEIKLVNYRNVLESQMENSIGFGILKGIVQLLEFAGPVGSRIGDAIGAGSTVIEDLANNTPSDVPDPTTSLPDGVNKYLEDFKEGFKEKQKLYQSQLSKADDMLSEVADVPAVAALKVRIKETLKELAEATEKASTGDNTALERIYKLKSDLDASLEETMVLLKKGKETQNTMNFNSFSIRRAHRNLQLQTNQKGESGDVEISNSLKNEKIKDEAPTADQPKVEKSINIVKKIKDFVKVAEIGIDIYRKVVKTESSIKNVEEALERNEENIEKLKEYEKAIYSTMLRMTQGIKDEVDNAVKTSAGKSHAALDVRSWKVQSAIGQIKSQLTEMTSGFKAQEKIVNTIDRVVYSMSTMIQVYDRIQDYYDQAQLADYISDITSDRANSVRIHISDNSLQESIDKLSYEIQKNIILEEYERSMTAVRQYVFPFVNYIGQYTLPNDLKVVKGSQTIADIVNNIAAALERLEKDVTVIKKDDKNLFPNQVFNSQDNENPPFYVWNSQEFLSQLFKGNEVMMNAAIGKGIQENAMKFNKIGVHFKAKCSQIQDELEKALSGFSIKMSHLGNSYYRCGNRVFVMHHGHIDIQHSVIKQDGDYYNQNDVYEKITSNDPLISPYSMWKMQLIGHDYDLLAQYIGQSINIELEGHGSYLNHEEDDEICTDSLEQYYEQVTSSIHIEEDSILVMNSVDAEECETQKTVLKTRRLQNSTIDGDSQSVNLDRIVTGKMIPTVPNHIGTDGGGSHFESNPLHHISEGNASAIQSANYSLLNVQGNLLLLDMLMRKVNRTPTKSGKIKQKNEDYAHRMAYRAYAPRN